MSKGTISSNRYGNIASAAQETHVATNGPATGSKRRFPTRQRPGTSVVVTVTFVLIFTFIIAMELLIIDDDNRLSLWNKAPEVDSSRDDGAEFQGFVRVTSEMRAKLNVNKAQPSDAARKVSSITGLMNSPPDSHSPGGAAAGRTLHQEPSNGQWSGSKTSKEWLQPPTNHSEVVTDWQPVTGTKEKFYVYSAFLDMRQGRYLRLIGATRTRGHEKVSCVYWYADPKSTPPVHVPAAVKVIRENWNLKYSAVFVLCPLFLYNLGRTIAAPDAVSVVANAADHVIGNRLQVLNRDPDPNTLVDGFAVCVKPFHYHFNRATQLIEFIELNRILGVVHFTFYNHTIGREVDCVLQEYVRDGLVTLMPWQLDMMSQKEIRTEGLFAAINDCLYRNMHRYRYLLMIDIDEFIIPHRNSTLVEMLQEFHKKVDPSKAGSFSFMNSFFYLQWPNDPNSSRLLVPLVTLQKTKRRAKFHPHKQRSKCIVVAKNVVEMGNHFVWEFLPGRGVVNVPPEIAFLHHYRVCEFGGNDCVKTQSVTDRTVYRYKTELVKRVEERMSNSDQNDRHSSCRNLSWFSKTEEPRPP